MAVAISDAQPARKVAVQRWAHSRGLEETDIEVNLAVAQQTLRTLQEDQGLTEPFAALLETYFIPFTSTGSNSVTSALTGTNNKNQTFAAGFLSFESDHLRTRKNTVRRPEFRRTDRDLSHRDPRDSSGTD